MHDTRYDLRHETDDRLLAGLQDLIAATNGTTAELLANLAEVDRRKLYVPRGYSSLFTYTLSLGLSESAAFKRIQCCRLARRLPEVFDVVARGDVHLSGLVVLAPRLNEANHVELLAAARHKSKREIEELVAARFAQPDAPARLRRLPSPRTAAAKAGGVAAAALPLLDVAGSTACGAPAGPVGSDASCTGRGGTATGGTRAAGAAAGPGRDAGPGGSVEAVAHAQPAGSATSSSPRASARALVEPLSAERFRLQVTLSRRARDLLLEAQALMRHEQPDGNLSQVCERALELLVEGLRRRKFASTGRGRTKARARSGAHAGSSARGATKARTEMRRGVMGTDPANLQDRQPAQCDGALPAGEPAPAKPGPATSGRHRGRPRPSPEPPRSAPDARVSLPAGEPAPAKPGPATSGRHRGRPRPSPEPPRSPSNARAVLPAGEPAPAKPTPVMSSRASARVGVWPGPCEKAPTPRGHPRRPRSRYIPADIKRAVAARDEYRCSFVGPDGHRCSEQAWLEYHHIEPFARGGETSVANVTLRCARHNAHQAELDYGTELIEARRRESRGRAREPAAPYESDC